jgi:hypothetical protein
MGFQHTHQKGHMIEGVRRALKSPRTPAHLKAHLQARLNGGTTMKSANSVQKQMANKTAAPPARKKVRITRSAKPSMLINHPMMTPDRVNNPEPLAGFNKKAFFGK